MNKEIILLTKSKKYHNYCIAGIDSKNGQWIRIISDDGSIHNAVEPKDIVYEDGTEAQVLDKIQIECTKGVFNYYQPENYVFDKQYFWEKSGQSLIKDVINLNKSDNDNYIFYNNGKKVSKELIEDLEISKRYSLKLIEPAFTKIHVTYWEDTGKTSVSACFYYNGVSYDFIPITDEKFTSIYLQKRVGTYSLDNVYFVMSLAEVYSDGYHYKLIASVIYK